MKQEDPYIEDRPWGRFIKFTANEPSTVKILTVNAGEAFSLQYHHHRSEQWYVISGKGTMEIGAETFPVIAEKTITIPPETPHRITATTEPITILEISRGSFVESDIVRIDDRYGRTP